MSAYAIGVFPPIPGESRQEEKKEVDEDDSYIRILEASMDTVKLVQSLSDRRPKGKLSECSDAEAAVELKLSIEFKGQTISTIRALPRIIQLGRDLAKESSSVPDIPRLEEGKNGRFTFLHAMLQSYTPLLEQWFRKIGRLVQTSPSFLHFLYETSFSNCDLHSIEESEKELEEDCE